MKNKWKELREAQEADIVNDEIEEVEDEVEEVETESNAALVEEVRAAYEAKLRELADFFIGEKPDKEANELLSTMVSEVKKPEPDHDVFWDVASKLDEKKEVILAKKAVTKNAESIAKEAEHAKVEKTEAATETESVKAEKVEAVEAEEVKPAEAEAKLKQPEPTKPDVKRSEISKGYKFRHAKADQQYDAEVESILRAIGIAAISGNAVEVLKLAEELAKATGTVSFCTLKTNAGKEITLMP